jgi:hypothetical protein
MRPIHFTPRTAGAATLFAALLLASCGPAGPSGPVRGDVRVFQSGLPVSTAATVAYDGAAAGTFTANPTALPHGGYTFSAAEVTSGGRTYRPVPPDRAVTVSGPTDVRFAFATLTETGELESYQESPTNNNNGIAFDLEASAATIVDGFELAATGAGTVTIRLYLRQGSSTQDLSDLTNWVEHDAVEVAFPGSNVLTPMSVQPFLLPANATVGVLLTTDVATFIWYANGEPVTTSDGVVALTTTAGRSSAGLVSADRRFHGAVQYTTPAPANAAFGGRLVLSGPAGTVTGRAAGFSHESDEGDHCGVPGDASTWWRWTAPASGSVTISVAANRSVALAVYTGGALDALTEVACQAGIQPDVSFAATQGTSYAIAVEDGDPAAGTYELHWGF